MVTWILPTDEADQYVAWQERYRLDFPAFLRDCVKWPNPPAGFPRGPAPYQVELGDSLYSQAPRGRFAARASRGAGKSAGVALLIHHFALTRDTADGDWKIPTTASVWAQLTHFLWPEVHKWARLLRWDVIGRPPYTRDELLLTALKLRYGESFAIASDRPGSMEGCHAQHLMWVFDESWAIPTPFWDAAEGSLSDEGGEKYAVAISKPGPAVGRFHDICARQPGLENWRSRHVQAEEAIAAGRLSREWAERMARLWGVGSALYQTQVAAEFAESGTAGIIPLEWLTRAQARWHDWDAAGRPGDVHAHGLDIAEGGPAGDASVLATVHRWGGGFVVAPLRTWPAGSDHAGMMEVAGQVGAMVRPARGRRAAVFYDSIGVGAGLGARLKEQGHNVLPFNASAGTKSVDSGTGEFGFANWRAFMWWNARELLDPASEVTLALPPDEELAGDLLGPGFKYTSASRIQVEAKVDVRARLGRSPDKADAVLMALAGPALWLERQQEGAVEVRFPRERRAGEGL